MPKQKNKVWIEIPSPFPGARAFAKGKLRLMVDRPFGKWHMSISHPTRNPTWEEIRDARYEFIPNEVTMAMILPPKEEYVNIHEYCFHLHEI
ncbi:hypothetical protein [Parageobacillus thermoglucosidasius]|uniref:DUF7694 domain-containing protein n=1 Tax=Parageobacillus thermoglucosidasius TaxID=1426 RepID=UPI000E19C7E7|nr:hypothetical protein [Parageobacillus thermoglucosidasius]REK58992.1 MAG: hypothetical protein C6P36_02840 [Geobacillus sp.]MED4904101.1 hypothetical protein [Parageobacillus thermoglucosidasius]MED4915651.1 hypothetical protein [Parageobacillus thermoglucosidasius]MED4945084.1 hypothetical protein [Parageobacillus thermoglucosidasius]MED4983719.1 hypothetical protein [Parageobacillus thermoglucosidasius]